MDDQWPVQVREQRSVCHKPIVFKWSREALPPLYPFSLYPFVTSATWHEAVEKGMLRIKQVLRLPRNTACSRALLILFVFMQTCLPVRDQKMSIDTHMILMFRQCGAAATLAIVS